MNVISRPETIDSETVAGLLIDGASKWGTRDFILFEDGGRWTWVDALAAGQVAAAALHAQGVRQGERVVVVLPNGADYLRAWWGIALLGAVMVPFNPTFVGRILEDLLETVDAPFAIAERDLPEAPAAMKRIGPELLSQAVEVQPPLPVIRCEDPHTIIFTSGTTGRSKGSLTSNLHVVSQSTWMAEDAGVSERDRYMGDLPLFHMAALGNVALIMRVGGTVALRTRPSLSQYWRIARETGATYGVLVSSMANALMQAPPSPDDRDHPIRFFLASPLPADREGFVERFGLEGLITAFGSTETATAIRKPLKTPCRSTSCGLLRPGYELRIVDENLEDVPVGTWGELLVRNERRARMSLGYFNNEEATAEAWRDGWYRTGDVFEQDADGFYYWRDRLKDSIRRRGENVSSQEVEREINTFPGVAESACIAVTGAFEGDHEIKAFVVCNGPVDFAELSRHLDGRLPPFMIPRFFEAIDELPKTPTMRIQKYHLKNRGAGPGEWDRQAAGVVPGKGRETA